MISAATGDAVRNAVKNGESQGFSGGIEGSRGWGAAAGQGLVGRCVVCAILAWGLATGGSCERASLFAQYGDNYDKTKVEKKMKRIGERLIFFQTV